MGNSAKVPLKRYTTKPKYHSQELARIQQMVQDIISGRISERAAAKKHHVTRYQITKWVNLLKKDILAESHKSIDEEKKQIIVKKILDGEFSARVAAKKFNLSLVMIYDWLKTSQELEKEKPAVDITGTKDEEIVNKIKVIRQVQIGEITITQAARLCNVTRYTIKGWIRDQTIINLDGIINHHNINDMQPDEKEKALLKEIEKLKKQMVEDKLKIMSLETLIEVAEEKFNIKIKKKPG